MTIKKIDLNDFEPVASESKIGRYGLIINPKELSDGTQLPPSHWKRILKHNLIEDTENVKWTEMTRIAIHVSEQTYAELVDWWFKEAFNNVEWSRKVNMTYNTYGFDVDKEVQNMKKWLKSRIPSARKSYMDRYVRNRLAHTFKLHRKKADV